MTDRVGDVPTWGAFRGVTAVSKFDHQRTIEPVATPEASHSPAFDIHSEGLPLEETFYATEHIGDRTEEEYDALGEGAIRQIGRNFVKLISATSMVALLGAFVAWAVPDDSADTNPTLMADASGSQILSDDPKEAAFGQAFYVERDTGRSTIAADEIKQFVEVNVVLPIPSIKAAAVPGQTPNETTLAENAATPWPVPFSRDVAMAAMSAFEEGPLAQGSDDEAIHFSGDEETYSSWVSVMIPKQRPSF